MVLTKIHLKRTAAALLAIPVLLLSVPANLSVDARVNGTANFSRNYTLTSNGGADVVAIAMAQVGKNGGELGYAAEEWCADFVSDCAILADEQAAIPTNAACRNMKKAVLDAGGDVVAASAAQPGDLVFYGSESSNHHVEIVYDQPGSTLSSLSTIGGNSGNSNNALSMVKLHPSQSGMSPFVVVRPNYSGNHNWEMVDDLRIDENNWTYPIYPLSSENTPVYNFGGSVASGHYISPGDDCGLGEVYRDNDTGVLYVHVDYPAGSKREDRYYARLDAFPDFGQPAPRWELVMDLRIDENNWTYPMYPISSENTPVYVFGINTPVSGHYISPGDDCGLGEVYRDTETGILYVHVDYPAGSRREDSYYARLDAFPALGHDASGNFEEAVGGTKTIHVGGWAQDEDDTSQPVDVHLYIDGKAGEGGRCIRVIKGGQDRGDGTYTGFSDTFVIDVPAGKHMLYAYAINLDGTGGNNALIGEKEITISDPENLGDEFDAQIINMYSQKYVFASDSDNNVAQISADVKGVTVNKVTWHFSRQDDGSYRIMSYHNERYIDAYGAEDTNGVNIWTYQYDPYSQASKWYIIKNGAGYVLRPSYSATRVMDVTGASTENRANVQLHEINDSAAQIFDIHKLDGDTEKPVIKEVTISNVTLEGYRVTAVVSDNVGVKRVQVPTWTEWNPDDNNQDDLIWHDAVQVDYNTWVCDISIHDHYNEHAKYISDVYAYDYSENDAMNRQVVEVGLFNLTVDPNDGSVMDTETKKASNKAVVYSPKLIYQGANWWDIRFAAASRKGYTLTGYYTKKSGGVKVYNADGSCVNEGTYFKDNNYQRAEDLTVYAQWEQILGDVNGDNTVSVQDVVMFQKWLLAKKGAKLTVPENADLDKDGVVDVYDIALLKRRILSK